MEIKTFKTRHTLYTLSFLNFDYNILNKNFEFKSKITHFII